MAPCDGSNLSTQQHFTQEELQFLFVRTEIDMLNSVYHDSHKALAKLPSPPQHFAMQYHTAGGVLHGQSKR
jgi:hypothetical protein